MKCGKQLEQTAFKGPRAAHCNVSALRCVHFLQLFDFFFISALLRQVVLFKDLLKPKHSKESLSRSAMTNTIS